MWQPAGGGEAISAAEAGYASTAAEATPEATLEAEAGVAPRPEADVEVALEVTEGVSDEAPVPVDAEDAAMHVTGPEDEVAADGDDAPVDLEAPVAAGEQSDREASDA